MPLRRSIRNKNRSLNLRQRKTSLEQVHNNVTNVDNTINVVTEVKDNNDDANESEFERYTESTEYNENELSENIDNENDYIDSDDENYHVDSNDENYHVDSDNENYHVDSDVENNSVSDNENEHKNLEDPESILENSSFSNSVFDVEYFTGDFVHISASNQLNCMRIISIVLHNNGLKLKLQRFLTFDELPAQFKTTDRYFNSNNKRWLLEEDKFIIVEPEVIILIAGLGLVTADLPQGNDLVGVMRHNAKRGCHSCKIENNDSLKSFNDLSKELQYHHLMDKEFDLILNSDSSTVQKNLCSKFGLKNQKPVLDYLIRDRFLQTPQDIYHAIAGKILKLMDCTFNMFNSSGNNEFIKNWKLFEMPIKWHKLPNPITHRQSFMMSDRLRLAMVLPHILRRYLHISHLKNNSLIELQENLSVNINKIIDKLIQCWVIVAKCAKVCFSLSFSNDSYNILNNLLNQETIILTKTFPQDFTYLPNLHINDGTSDSRYNNHLGNGYFQDNIFRSLLSSWYATSTTMPNNKEIVDETVEPPDNCIYEIRLQAKWKLHQILQNNFETNMSIDGDIYYSLKTAYKEYFNFTEYLHNNKIVYFNYITYKVLNQKDDETSIIQIHVGDIVELEEELEGNSYAIIQAIFLHTYNNGKTYPFYFLKWFEKIEGRNGIDMMCQKYKICTERKKWHNIFPISFITSMPKVHFVHQCVNNCSVRNHDLSQPYLLNEFFYNAI
ncbi:unnamed protein product [Rhizophagus irregularis]|nr:unnamed protein product [Rhizophagus irregularis]